MEFDGASSEQEIRRAMVVAGTPVLVEVRNRFDGAWSGGFQVIEALVEDDETVFRLRRLSDGRVLPELFRSADVFIR